jgi:hypothetical protein
LPEPGQSGRDQTNIAPFRRARLLESDAFQNGKVVTTLAENSKRRDEMGLVRAESTLSFRRRPESISNSAHHAEEEMDAGRRRHDIGRGANLPESIVP